MNQAILEHAGSLETAPISIQFSAVSENQNDTTEIEKTKEIKKVSPKIKKTIKKEKP